MSPCSCQAQISVRVERQAGSTASKAPRRCDVGHGSGSVNSDQMRLKIAKLSWSAQKITRTHPKRAATAIRARPASPKSGPISASAWFSMCCASSASGPVYGSCSEGSGCIDEIGRGVVGVASTAGANHGEDDATATAGGADYGGAMAFARLPCHRERPRIMPPNCTVGYRSVGLAFAVLAGVAFLIRGSGRQ